MMRLKAFAVRNVWRIALLASLLANGVMVACILESERSARSWLYAHDAYRGRTMDAEEEVRALRERIARTDDERSALIAGRLDTQDRQVAARRELRKAAEVMAASIEAAIENLDSPLP